MSTASQARLSVIPESTPNPNSTKFVVNRTLLSGAGRDFPNREAAQDSLLARELFLLPGVSGVYIGSNFVTVTAAGNVWALPPLVIQAIETHVNSGIPAVGTETVSAPIPRKPDSPLEAGILRILENEIRPAVAMDGGDITFAGYENGVLKVHLRGACHSCPSSTVTLKNGIETRLRQEFPEILRVEAV